MGKKGPDTTGDYSYGTTETGTVEFHDIDVEKAREARELIYSKYTGTEREARLADARARDEAMGVSEDEVSG